MIGDTVASSTVSAIFLLGNAAAPYRVAARVRFRKPNDNRMKNLKLSTVTLLLLSLVLAFSCTKEDMAGPAGGNAQLNDAVTLRDPVTLLPPPVETTPTRSKTR